VANLRGFEDSDQKKRHQVEVSALDKLKEGSLLLGEKCTEERRRCGMHPLEVHHRVDGQDDAVAHDGGRGA